MPATTRVHQIMLIAIMASLIVVGGCERPATTPDRGEESLASVAKSGTDVAGVEEIEPALNAGAAKTSSSTQHVSSDDGVGKRCLVDDHCSRYLRCIEERCAIPPAITGKATETTPRVAFRREGRADSDELGRFHVELATTPEEMSRGLMYRRSMQPDWGMIFIYDDDRILRFWMKNTLIPLDMVFVHSSGEVMGVVANAEPLTLTPRSIEKPARYVVELNAGKAAEHGIEAGTWMSVEHVDELFQPGR